MSIRWSLGETTPYTAGGALQGVIYLSNPESVQITGYILGTLLTQAGAPILESLFNVAWDGQRAVAVAGWGDLYRWSIPPSPWGGYALEAPFTFTLGRSDAWLRLVLYRMVSSAPDPETDPILGQVSTWLASPPALMEQMMPVIGMAMAMAMLGMLMKEFK